MTLLELRRIQKSDRERLKRYKSHVERSLEIAKELNPKSKKSELVLMKRSKNLPATQEMLNKTREELLSRMSEFEHRINIKFKKSDAKFLQLESKLDQVLEMMMASRAENARCLALYEELSNNNRAVFDGWDDLNQRMERMELNWLKKFGAEV